MEIDIFAKYRFPKTFLNFYPRKISIQRPHKINTAGLISDFYGSGWSCDFLWQELMAVEA